MHSLKQLAGQTAVYGMSSILGRALNYALLPLYTRIFSPPEYGVVTEMYTYVAIFIVLLTFGMETSFFRFVSKSDQPKRVYNTAIVPVISISVLFISACLLFAQDLANIIQYPNHPEYIIWFAIIIGFDAITSIPLARLRQENKPLKFAWINLSSIGINILIVLFFLIYCKQAHDADTSNWMVDKLYNPSFGVGYIFVANLISSLFKAILLFPFIRGISLSIDKVLLKKMLLYASPLLIAGLAGMLNENLDKLLLKYVLLRENSLSDAMFQVGVYGACYKISILITLFIQSYRYAAEPFFFNKSKESDAHQIYADMMKYFVIACLLIFLVLMLNIDLVMFFVGEEYRIGVGVVPILLMANIFLGIYYNLSVWYKLTDKTIVGAYISIGGAIVTLVVNLILIPKIGFMGSAWATLFCYLSMAFTSYLLGRVNYRIPYPIVKLGGYFLLVLGIYTFSVSLNFVGPLKWIINNAAFLGVALIIYILEKPKKIII